MRLKVIITLEKYAQKQGLYISRYIAIITITMFAVGCTGIDLQDCPDGSVLGKDVTRIRSSHLRMEIADTTAAAKRVVPYAIISAIAYRDGVQCPAGQGLSDTDITKLEEMLVTLEPDGQQWARVKELELTGGCEDDIGLSFHVWQRTLRGQTDVIMAFRGTSGEGDWLFGNLWGLTRFFLRDNQYKRASEHADRVIAHYEAKNENVRFLTTGHSLGGGLAQHVLYSHPTKVLQAIVFAPSSVTGFTDVNENIRLEACACKNELGSEARILRIYESYEILSDLRIFHKLFFPPQRNIQEVRFAFSESVNQITQHSMIKLATLLYEAAQKKQSSDSVTPWFASQDRQCTARFIELQSNSCKLSSSSGLGACPQ